MFNRTVPFLILGFLLFATHAKADEAASVAIFERSVAPSYIWGQNGLMLTPIADTLGEWNVGISSTQMNAGRIEGDRVLDTKTTLTVDTNGFFEFGYTRKSLIFPASFERTPFTSNIYHLKSKMIDFHTLYLPKFALGTFAYNIRGSRKIHQEDLYADLFGVLQEDIPIADDHMVRFHLGLENGVLGTTTTQAFLFGGVDYIAFDKLIDAMVEVQGGSRENQSGIINAGLAVNIYHIGQASVGIFNIANFGESREKREFLFQLSVNLPMDRGYRYVRDRYGEPVKEKPPVVVEPKPAPPPPTPSFDLPRVPQSNSPKWNEPKWGGDPK